jgi:hypothetical protein
MDILKQLAVAIANIDSRLSMDEGRGRDYKAPGRGDAPAGVQDLGHALGRLIQRRDPCACRVVFKNSIALSSLQFRL